MKKGRGIPCRSVKYFRDGNKISSIFPRNIIRIYDSNNGKKILKMKTSQELYVIRNIDENIIISGNNIGEIDVM